MKILTRLDQNENDLEINELMKELEDDAELSKHGDYLNLS